VTNEFVIIAGGGIGGLATALTLHQIGVPCVVFEAVRDMRPLGVGINLQPNAVRELYDLSFTPEDLDRVGLPAKEWALVGLNGNDIYSEPRGLLAGYNWRGTTWAKPIRTGSSFANCRLHFWRLFGPLSLPRKITFPDRKERCWRRAVQIGEGPGWAHVNSHKFLVLGAAGPQTGV
jgi:hypothetical protein